MRRTLDLSLGQQCEPTGPMWLQIERTPDSRDRGLRNPDLLGKSASAPVRRAVRRALERRRYDAFDRLVTDLARRSRSRFIEQTLKPLLDETTTSFTHRRFVNADLCSDRAIRMPLGAEQDNARPRRELLCGFPSPHESFERLTFFLTQLERDQSSSSSHHLCPYCDGD